MINTLKHQIVFLILLAVFLFTPTLAFAGSSGPAPLPGTSSNPNTQQGSSNTTGTAPISTKFDELNTAINLKGTLGGANSIGALISNLGVINLLFFFVGVVFMGSLIAAGAGFITSSGSPEGISKANQRMINSLMGLAITFGAFVIVKIVLAVVGASDINIF